MFYFKQIGGETTIGFRAEECMGISDISDYL